MRTQLKGLPLFAGRTVAKLFLNGTKITDFAAPLQLSAGANTITGSGKSTLSGGFTLPYATSQALLVDMATTTANDTMGVAYTAFSSSNYNANYQFFSCVSEASPGFNGGGEWATAGVQTNFFGGVLSNTAFAATAIRLKGRAANSEHPTRWRIEVSNDTTTGTDGVWATILDKTASDEVLNAARGVLEFALPAPSAYKAYRIYVTASAGSNPGLNVFQLLGSRGTQAAGALTINIEASATLTLPTASTALTAPVTISNGTVLLQATAALGGGGITANGGVLDTTALQYNNPAVTVTAAGTWKRWADVEHVLAPIATANKRYYKFDTDPLGTGALPSDGAAITAVKDFFGNADVTGTATYDAAKGKTFIRKTQGFASLFTTGAAYAIVYVYQQAGTTNQRILQGSGGRNAILGTWSNNDGVVYLENAPGWHFTGKVCDTSPHFGGLRRSSSGALRRINDTFPVGNSASSYGGAITWGINQGTSYPTESSDAYLGSVVAVFEDISDAMYNQLCAVTAWKNSLVNAQVKANIPAYDKAAPIATITAGGVTLT